MINNIKYRKFEKWGYKLGRRKSVLMRENNKLETFAQKETDRFSFFISHWLRFALHFFKQS